MSKAEKVGNKGGGSDQQLPVTVSVTAEPRFGWDHPGINHRQATTEACMLVIPAPGDFLDTN
jgi:hypothetical protein